MKERMMRITAGCAALLLILVYVFFPVRDIVIRAGNGGRTKLELQEGEKVSWAWSPEITGKTMLRIRLSGMKNAQNVTLHAELTEENGDVVSTAAISGSELEKDAGKSIQLEGIFQKERKYLLTMWTDGGTLKVRGAEEAETGFFLSGCNRDILHGNPESGFAVFCVRCIYDCNDSDLGSCQRGNCSFQPKRTRYMESTASLGNFCAADDAGPVTCFSQTAFSWMVWRRRNTRGECSSHEPA